MKSSMSDICGKYINCKGCPDEHKDFCESVKDKLKQAKKDKKERIRKKFDAIITEFKPYFKDVINMGNDSYRLILPDDTKINYYPTTEKILFVKSGYTNTLDVNSFAKYFNFLKPKQNGL